MHFATLFVSFLAFAGVVPYEGLAQSSIVDAFIANEGPVAKAGVLANIGPDGAKSNGAKAGIVIASPSVSPSAFTVSCGTIIDLACRRPRIPIISSRGRETRLWSSRC